MKDVVAHMVGWERGDVEEIKRIWETKTPPWWKNDPNYDEFNYKWVGFYKDYTPEQLIAEWEMWQRKVTKEVEFLTAEQEDIYTIAQANAPLDNQSKFVNERVKSRLKGEFPIVPPFQPLPLQELS